VEAETELVVVFWAGPLVVVIGEAVSAASVVVMLPFTPPRLNDPVTSLMDASLVLSDAAMTFMSVMPPVRVVGVA
jgi:hypothetical protein